jgi:hypothetical protein
MGPTLFAVSLLAFATPAPDMIAEPVAFELPAASPPDVKVVGQAASVLRAATGRGAGFLITGWIGPSPQKTTDLILS